jgi:hypothetical protein
VRTLAANDRDLRLVDLLETQHVAVGLAAVDGWVVGAGLGHRACSSRYRIPLRD